VLADHPLDIHRILCVIELRDTLLRRQTG